jgi:hypothetical protein
MVKCTLCNQLIDQERGDTKMIHGVGTHGAKPYHAACLIKAWKDKATVEE